MLRVIIIDDESHAIETLSEDIRKYFNDVNIIATCQDPTKAKELIIKHQPDLIFLDIQMPMINGFQLLESMEEINFEVIFVTAYDEFAIKAFEFSVADYLMKPIDKNRLVSTIDRIRKRKSENSIEERISVILHNLKLGSKQYPTLAVPLSDGIEFVPVEEIKYLKSDSNYCYVHLINDLSLYVSKPLKHFCDLLEGFDFIRVHQSYYVNVRYIRKYTKSDGGEIILNCGTRIPISRLYKQNLMDFITK